MRRLMPDVTRRRGRPGMTLIEIMIALVLLGIVGGVLMRVIMRQQRFYQGVNQIMTQRGQLRQATAVLPIDLRSLSSVGADILTASDSSMEFMVNVGTSVVCETVAGTGGTQVALPPEVLANANGQVLTSWQGYGEPDVSTYSYSVYIYNDSSVAGNEDDRWQRFSLVKLHHSASVCLSSFTTLGDAGKQRPILELSSTEPNDPITGGPLSQYINAGAPVRVLKRVRYKLYPDTDGKWYLGFSNYIAATSTYENLSPVSGPYDPYAATGSGLRFRYYDVDGNEIASGADSTTRSKIARVDLIARARTSANVRAAGIQAGVNQQYKDSLAVSVMLRNRN
jgi:prepilin-type N-terminal cleavage/methylation domain-containing protein